MYKILLFDLDNTLLDFDLAENIALTKLLEEQKVENLEEYKKAYTTINKSLWEKLEKNEITRTYLVNNRFKMLFEKFGNKKDGNYLSNRYKEILGMQGQHIKGAYELLEKLKKSNYKLYAVTNGMQNIQNNRLKNSKITKFFDGIFISEKVGYQKPNIKFFEYIANKIPNFTKDKSIIIGDSLNADIKGGIDFGIDTAWINFKNLKIDLDIKPKYIIKNYKDLEDILVVKKR